MFMTNENSLNNNIKLTVENFEITKTESSGYLCQNITLSKDNLKAFGKHRNIFTRTLQTA